MDTTTRGKYSAGYDAIPMCESLAEEVYDRLYHDHDNSEWQDH